MPENTPLPEVRTRRLVITDDLDHPRIVAEVVHGMAELRAMTDDPGTHVLLYAGSPAPDGAGAIGVELFVEGNSVGRLHAWSDGDGWHWRIAAEV
ncbi:MAG: hypothetical protein ACRDZR_01400 [Acidimicrobiales bacterium]